RHGGGHHAATAARRGVIGMSLPEHARAFPRLHRLWIDSKEPRYSGNRYCKIPDAAEPRPRQRQGAFESGGVRPARVRGLFRDALRSLRPRPDYYPKTKPGAADYGLDRHAACGPTAIGP